MSVNKVHRIPRFKRKYPSVFSYRSELLYGRRFMEKLRKPKQVIGHEINRGIEIPDKVTGCKGCAGFEIQGMFL